MSGYGRTDGRWSGWLAGRWNIDWRKDKDEEWEGLNSIVDNNARQRNPTIISRNDKIMDENEHEQERDHKHKRTRRRRQGDLSPRPSSSTSIADAAEFHHGRQD